MTSFFLSWRHSQGGKSFSQLMPLLENGYYRTLDRDNKKQNNYHCWKILLILVLGKVASKTQYSHFVICKVWVLGFTHHFTLHPLIWQIFSLISWLYFSTMWILWGRKCDYWVFHITHAKKGLPNHSSSTRDLKDFFSICDVENTILTYPPHSILSLYISRQCCTF